jgi:anti-sigma B factor antagonist
VAERHTLSLGGLRVAWETPTGDHVEVALSGDLDNLSIPVLQQAFEGFYGRGCFNIQLDLTGLVFLDSSGLGVLVAAWRRCQPEGGGVTVRHPSLPVKRLMDMTGVGNLLLAP